MCRLFLYTGLCVAMGVVLLRMQPVVVALQPDQREFRVELVDVPRPISDAVRQVERHFGRVVTYEDVSYVAPNEIVDVTEQVRRDGKVGRRVLAMRGDGISLIYRPTSASVDAQLDEVLAQLLAQWNGTGRSGQFRVQSVSGGHHIVPTAIKGRNENVEIYASPLDTRITIPYEERDGLETVQAVAKAISDGARRVVIPGMLPLNGLSRARLSVGAQDETAREVLWRTLQAIDKTLSWQVLCEAGEGALCAINIHSVRRD